MRWLGVVAGAIFLLISWSAVDFFLALRRHDQERRAALSAARAPSPAASTRVQDRASETGARKDEQPAPPTAPDSAARPASTPEDRIRELAVIIERDPYNEGALRDLLMQVRAIDDLQATAEACRRILVLAPQDREIAAIYEETLGRIGDGRAAIEVLARATREAPDDAAVWIRYGAALSDADRLNEAIEAFSSALRLEPGLAPHIRATRGSAYARLEIWDAAASDLEASGLAPTDADVALTLARVFAELTRWADARKTLDPWRAERPRDVRFINLAAEIEWRRHLRSEDGALDEARRYWALSLDVAPGQPEIRDRLMQTGGLPLR